MRIDRLHIEHFKSIDTVDIDLGRVNVFIGANGVGKTSILEALGFISTTMLNSPSNVDLSRIGVRASSKLHCKNSSKQRKPSSTINFGIDWQSQSGRVFSYSFSLKTPSKNSKPLWVISKEELVEKNIGVLLSRGKRKTNYPFYSQFDVSRERSIYGAIKGIASKDSDSIDWNDIDITSQLNNYAVFNPNLIALRGLLSGVDEVFPTGLYGENLVKAAKATKDELTSRDNLDLLMKYVFVNQWVSNIGQGKVGVNLINQSDNLSMSEDVLIFRDRFMASNRDSLNMYEVNEGVLYCLFIGCLLHHPNAPAIFSIDNFDSGLNPLVVQKVTRMICDDIRTTDRTLLLTTHNPMALDGLDLFDDNIRLFIVDRTIKGDTYVERLKPPNADLLSKYPLSELWLSGRLGGVPNL